MAQGQNQRLESIIHIEIGTHNLEIQNSTTLKSISCEIL